MKRYILFTMVIILVAISASACDSAKLNENPDQAEIDLELWLTPLIPTDTQVPGSFGTLAGPMYQAISLAEILQMGPEFDHAPGDWSIATPLVPSFYIKSARIHECNGQAYVMINVVNNGPYYFQFITLGVNHGASSFGQYGWEDPWIFAEAQCPVATTGWPSYAPGWDGGWIYQPVTVDPAFNEYHIHLSMCTFTSIPDACPYRYYLLTEDYSTKTPTPWLAVWPDVKLKELVLCWVGPGPEWEVVNSIPEGEEVELLGKGEDEDFIVVQEPKYQRECWMHRKSAEDIPPEIFMELRTFIAPPLPTDTPTAVAAGEVKGRFFRDRDGDNIFDTGDDVAIPGARVSLAPGTCSSPGQAITMTTNSNGRYSFSNVSAGNYCLSAPLPSGFKKFSVQGSYNITVTGGGAVQKNFGCQ